jgi:TPP-dependent pyruvate/acetoin dehydrogenase alpha subunit
MGGHATHDEREARETFPDELFEHWGRRDPVGLYEEYLVLAGIGRDRLQTIEDEVEAEIEAAAAEALRSRDGAMPEPASAARGVYA